jgi:undecaprenyl-diphosphatase
MNALDTTIIRYLNQFANRSQLFDWLVVRWSESELLKGAVMMFLVWWAAFGRGERDEGRKSCQILISMLLAASASVAVARILAWIVPFRERPLRVSALQFHLPYRMDGGTLPGWSSFPSDHAVLFIALAVCILFVSRPLGWISLFYVGTFICLPRIYLGIHWPTDILAGAVFGTGFAYLTRIPVLNEAVGMWTSRWHRERPGLLFALLFLLSFQVATLFREIRLVLPALSNWMR